MSKDQRSVCSAEAKGVLHGIADRHLTSNICAVIQIAFRILIENVDRGRRNLILQCQNRKDGFDAAGAAQEVSGHRLSGVDH